MWVTSRPRGHPCILLGGVGAVESAVIAGSEGGCAGEGDFVCAGRWRLQMCCACNMGGPGPQGSCWYHREAGGVTEKLAGSQRCCGVTEMPVGSQICW